MAKTLADLVAAAYAEVTLDGAPASAADTATITARVPPIVADLVARRVAAAIDTASIPDALFPALVSVIAAWVGPLFGRPLDPKALEAAENRLAESGRLDRSLSSALVKAILEQLQIWGAGQIAVDASAVAGRLPGELASLTARNVAYVPDEDALSDAMRPAVIRYVAAMLTPRPPEGVAAAAERELRTLQRIGAGTGGNLRVDRALLGFGRRGRGSFGG